MLAYLYDSFSKWDYTHVAPAIICSYFLYYFYKVVHRPELVAAEGVFKTMLNENLHVLKEHFWPSFWAFNKHQQTICRVVFKSKPVLPYSRETIKTKDHGQISLDWVYNDNENYPDSKTRPTVIVMPGITGCYDASYVRHIVKEAQDLGYRALVFNNRGLGKTELKTPRTFCACNGEDLELVLDHVTKRFPESPLYMFAVSLGGVILTNYLSRATEENLDIKIKATLIVSAPWCSFRTIDSLEQPVNWFLYNRFILNKLKGLVKANITVFNQHKTTAPYKIEDAMKASSIREFDEAFTAKTFGFPSYKEYYQESSLVLKPLEKIQIPMLFLNARDDPFAPIESIPLESIKKNPNMAIILTDYGGHIGFVEGAFVRGRSIVERLFNQYFSCVIKMDNKLK